MKPVLFVDNFDSFTYNVVHLLVSQGAACDVTLNDPSVSRAHAVVETAGTEPTVRDLGSTNGTFVNGARVQAARLRDGDELRFGNTQMQFEASI